MLSIIIPSYKDPLLHKTIDNILQNAEGEIEIIAVLDGYWIEQIINDPRVKLLHLGRNRGMREAINAGVAISKGEYLMRADEHQAFGKGFDRIILETIQDNWIVTPRRYFLDVEKWQIMDIPPVDFMKLKIASVGEGVKKFSGVEATGNSEMIQESMAMQGSCWFMKRSWWDKVIGRLQNEGYGPHYQDSIEMVFKTWQAGGKLMVNKNTWHAHKHRMFPRTHNNGTPENPSNNEACWKYAIEVWGEYFEKVSREWFKRSFTKYEKFGPYHWELLKKGGRYQQHLDNIVQWVKEKNILDIGAGDGLITYHLKAKGIENNQTAVKLAKEKGADVIFGDAYALPFKDEEFESALMIDVLEHCEFPKLALKEARRVLKNYLYVTTPPKGIKGDRLLDEFHYTEWSPEELKELVEAEGFQLEGEIITRPDEKNMYAKFKKR